VLASSGRALLKAAAKHDLNKCLYVQSFLQERLLAHRSGSFAVKIKETKVVIVVAAHLGTSSREHCQNAVSDVREHFSVNHLSEKAAVS
jgi:hypothetical protein